MKTRCPWAGDDPLMIAYHDEEWGVPVHDDRLHFEFLVLESAQAGLSWRTILHKREGYRRAFAGLDPVAVAGFDEARVEELILDAAIVRNRAKIRDRTFDFHRWRIPAGRRGWEASGARAMLLRSATRSRQRWTQSGAGVAKGYEACDEAIGSEVWRHLRRARPPGEESRYF